MTPERKTEIDKQIAWWRQQEEWRVNGFGIECNDPLFTLRAVQPPPPEPKPITVLWCRIWLNGWLKIEKDFTFTGRIQYTHRRGKFVCMSLEISRPRTQKLWQNFWRETYDTTTHWVAADNFEDREDYVNEYESTIVDNGKTIT